jgi:hypothetical protein
MTDGVNSLRFAEMLQHNAQTGKTGLFLLKHAQYEGAMYLVSGIVAHCETSTASGEAAAIQMLSWPEPTHRWIDGENPRRMTMSASAQDLMMKAIQSGGESVSSAAAHAHNILHAAPDPDAMFLMTLDISSKEIRPFRYIIKTRQVRMGRHPDNDLVIADTSLSRRHAVLIPNYDAILVRDLGSMNGITIDGEPVTQGLLRDGQILTVGEVVCRISITKVDRATALSMGHVN